MNKTAIKNFAVWAREKLIADIKYKASMIGITEQGILEKLPQSTDDMHFFDIGTKSYIEVSGKEINQRNSLIKAIREKEEDIKNYKDAFNYVVEEVAYTWFNRLIAIRFMEVNDYLPSGVRVLSSENKDKLEPDFVTMPFETDLEFTQQEKEHILQQKEENKLDELFRMLFIKQCNKLHEILPELFEKTDDYTELLLTISFTDKEGIVYKLTHDIDAADFDVSHEGQVEIIGWLYQYYNTEPKAAVFARKSGTKIAKEEIPAATQLFTPDWIVRYMVENSLGRLFIVARDSVGSDQCSVASGSVASEAERIEAEKAIADKMGWKYYLPEAAQEPKVREKLNALNINRLDPAEIKVIEIILQSLIKGYKKLKGTPLQGMLAFAG